MDPWGSVVNVRPAEHADCVVCKQYPYAVLARRPLPSSVTTVPTIPCPTLSEKLEVTLNVADGEKDPSAIATVFAPMGDDGTRELQTLPPEALLVVEQSVVEGSQVTVEDADPSNPLPVTTIAVPTTPDVGLTTTAGSTVESALPVTMIAVPTSRPVGLTTPAGSTVKGAFAEFEFSAAPTVCPPAVDEGTENVQSKSPTLFVVETVHETTLASQVSV